MKKLISLILALVMLLSLGLCSGAAAEKEVDTKKIGVLAALNIDEEEMTKYVKASGYMTGRLVELGYCEAPLLIHTNALLDGNLDLRVVYYDTLDSMQMALSAGDIFSMYLYTATARYLCAVNDELVQVSQYKPLDEDTSLVIKNAYNTFKRNDFAFLMAAGNEALRDEFNEAITAIREDGTMEKLTAEYIEDVIAGKDVSPIEIPVIEGAETIKVAITGCLPPMDYIAPDGTAAGFNTALLAEISKRLGKNIELLQVDSLGRSAAVASGVVDAVFWTRTNSVSSQLVDVPIEEIEKNIQAAFDAMSEEDKKIDAVLRETVDFAEYWKMDIPEDTIVTIPYYTDMGTMVILKTSSDNFLADQ